MKKKRFNYFSLINPYSCFLFYIFAGVSCFCFNSPLFLAVSFLCALLNCGAISGIKSMIKSAAFSLFITMLFAVINPLFNHGGATPLIYINDRAFTLEAAIYGAFTGIMICCCFLWFGNMSKSIDSDKILYITSGILPTTGLMLAMIFKSTSSMENELEEIRAVQGAFGITTEKGTLKNKLRDASSLLSALTNVFLEKGTDTAVSMKSRGFGTGKRSRGRKYAFLPFDFFLIFTVIFICVLMSVLKFNGDFDFTVLPSITYAKVTAWTIFGLTASFLMLIMPVIYNFKEGLKWNSIKSKI